MRLSDWRGSLPAALFVWTLVVCVLPNAALSFTETMTLPQRLTNLLLPLGLWWLLMSLSSKVGRTALLMFPLMFFGAFQLVLLSLYGRSVIAVDMFLNLVTTNPGEVGELLGNMVGILCVVVLLYIPPIVGGIAGCRSGWRLSGRFMAISRRCAAIVLSAGILCFCLSFTGSRPFRPSRDIYPLNVFCNVVEAADRTARFADYPATSGGYNHHSRIAVPADSCRRLVVLIVGETSRADRWQAIGYERPTSPGITAENGYTVFSRALSESNTTHKSVPMLLSHLHADSFGDSIYSVKGIVTAFREAGFRTAFFSNQRYNHSFIDSFGFEADTCVFIKERDGKDHYDHELTGLLADEISRGDSLQLVVLHTYGSHFSYGDRYPADSAIFTPDGPLEATVSNKPALDNAYDNTVRYTASLIAAVAEIVERSGAEGTVLYTSDHGEDIFDDDRGLFLHASPAPSAWQIHVPFIVWFSKRYSDAHPAMVVNARSNISKDLSTSRSYFQTALQLGGIASAVSDTTASVVSAGYMAPPRRYLNDHNEGVALTGSGLLEADIRHLHSRGISTD